MHPAPLLLSFVPPSLCLFPSKFSPTKSYECHAFFLQVWAWISICSSLINSRSVLLLRFLSVGYAYWLNFYSLLLNPVSLPVVLSLLCIIPFYCHGGRTTGCRWQLLWTIVLNYSWTGTFPHTSPASEIIWIGVAYSGEAWSELAQWCHSWHLVFLINIQYEFRVWVAEISASFIRLSCLLDYFISFSIIFIP